MHLLTVLQELNYNFPSFQCAARLLYAAVSNGNTVRVSLEKKEEYSAVCKQQEFYMVQQVHAVGAGTRSEIYPRRDLRIKRGAC